MANVVDLTLDSSSSEEEGEIVVEECVRPLKATGADTSIAASSPGQKEHASSLATAPTNGQESMDVEVLSKRALSSTHAALPRPTGVDLPPEDRMEIDSAPERVKPPPKTRNPQLFAASKNPTPKALPRPSQYNSSTKKHPVSTPAQHLSKTSDASTNKDQLQDTAASKPPAKTTTNSPKPTQQRSVEKEKPVLTHDTAALKPPAKMATKSHKPAQQRSVEKDKPVLTHDAAASKPPAKMATNPPKPTQQITIEKPHPLFTHALLLGGGNNSSAQEGSAKDGAASLKAPSEMAANAQSADDDYFVPQDPIFRDDAVLEPIEMEVLFLGVESMYCLDRKTYQWDFIWEYASRNLKVRLRQLGTSVLDQDYLPKLVWMDDWLVEKRYQAVEEFVSYAYMRGYRRPIMAKVVAHIRLNRLRRAQAVGDEAKKLPPLRDYIRVQLPPEPVKKSGKRR